MEKITGDLLRGHLDLMVLSVLERGEAHGYEIVQRLGTLAAGALQLKEGTLYPALYRLEEAGMIKARWESGANERRGPRRRIYRLTSKGSSELARQRDTWRDFVSVVGRIVELAT